MDYMLDGTMRILEILDLQNTNEIPIGVMDTITNHDIKIERFELAQRNSLNWRPNVIIDVEPRTPKTMKLEAVQDLHVLHLRLHDPRVALPVQVPVRLDLQVPRIEIADMDMGTEEVTEALG